MSLPVIAKRLEQTIADNSPAILTGIGVAGVVTTAVLTGRATFRAAELINEKNTEKDINDLYMDPKEAVELCWKLYIPPAVTMTLSVAAIIGANRVGTRRAAALAAAYSLSEKAFDDYKEKVVEKLGKGKEQEVRDEIAQEKVNKNVPNAEVYITGTGEVLCYDTITGRTFKSDMERLRQAQNDLNKLLIDNVYASLTDFYELIGLPGTPYSNEVGWNTENLLELSFSSTLAEGVPCIAVDYSVTPVREYWMNCP